MKNIYVLDLTLCTKTGKFHNLECTDRTYAKCGTEKLMDKLKIMLPEMEVEWKKWAMQTTTNEDRKRYENHFKGKFN
jgi:hypothetical protein